MEHLAIFSLIVILPFGVTAVLQLFQSFRKYKRHYLQTYAYILLFLTFIILASLVNNYVFANVYQRFVSKPGIIIEAFYRLLASIVHIAWIISFVVLVRQLLQKEVSPKLKRIFQLVGISLCGGVFGVFLYSLVTVYVMPVLIVNVAMGLVNSLSTIGLLLYMVIASSKLPDKGKQTAVRGFGLILLVSFAILVFFAIAHMFFHLSNDGLVFFSFFFMLVMYGAPLLFGKRFIVLYHGTLETAGPDKDHLEKLFQKYHISNREREVIQLVCEGKTNKQIEDHLFISIQTVKDHVSNIYQKTGVKNRVQLTNLFRNAGTL